MLVCALWSSNLTLIEKSLISHVEHHLKRIKIHHYHHLKNALNCQSIKVIHVVCKLNIFDKLIHFLQKFLHFFQTVLNLSPTEFKALTTLLVDKLCISEQS